MSINYDNNCFPGIVTSDETCFRFTDKSNANSPNERLLFSNWWREQINQFGTQVSYFVNTFNTLSADNIYGEQPTKAFADPRNIVIAATLNDNAITLSQFGFQSDDDVTAYIHISSFETTFNDLTSVWSTQHNIIEPKAGDVFQLSEFGNDRPNDRQAKYFEITEKLDQDIASMNQLGGHYVFLIKAKRLDYSFEPNIPFPLSGGNAQVFEGAGKFNAGNDQLTMAGFTGDDTHLNGIYEINKNSVSVGLYDQISPTTAGSIIRQSVSNTDSEGVTTTDYNWEMLDGTDNNPGSGDIVSSTVTRDSSNPTIPHPYELTWPSGITLVKINNKFTAEKKDNYDEYDIDQSSKDVFDMSSNDDVYGDYY